MANTLGGVALGDVSAEEVSPSLIGNRWRDVNGNAHADFVAAKRSWRIEREDLTQAEYDALYAVYTNALGGAVALHLDSVGVDVFVHVTDWRAPRKAFGNGGTWEQYGRDLSFTAEEV